MNPESAANNRISTGKPPSRLQKQAPATLQLHQNPNNQCQDPSKTVIPLLSPLVLSPDSVTEAGHCMEHSSLTRGDNGNREANGKVSPVQHPVTSESSSLHTCFMSQCTILPRKQ
ncbi:hypothetical protein SSX86_015256 [Deinandra increscens subsp. villosa]|uniref:Uncharacterized protein n=1 Tax=Deinandra increscens subsp. villosa TaxID=3103831 RepID=A0AAP0CZR1_9ASTR